MKNIYKIGKELFITSDEEIKEGDWVYTSNKTIMLVTVKYSTESSFMIGNNNNEKSPYYIEFCKKIILTTDQDLIKDGVQAIDDEFLEWFVKNPSCEKVEVDILWNDDENFTNDSYKIIIPNEEPKQIKCYCGHTTMCDCSPIEESKQQTLEEVAVNCWAEGTWDNRDSFTDGFVQGAKWQQERMYSEAFGIIYVLETLLDFAGEDNATSISISTTDAEKIIKLLKQQI